MHVFGLLAKFLNQEKLERVSKRWQFVGCHHWTSSQQLLCFSGSFRPRSRGIFSSPLEMKVTSWWTSTATCSWPVKLQVHVTAGIFPSLKQKHWGLETNTITRDETSQNDSSITELQTIIQTSLQTPCVTQSHKQLLNYADCHDNKIWQYRFLWVWDVASCERRIKAECQGNQQAPNFETCHVTSQSRR
jgi:hypothetical protein